MKKRVVSILLTGLAVLSLAACTSNGLEAASATNDNAKEAEAGTEKKEGISVYWVGKTLNNPWWISVSDFAQQTADNPVSYTHLSPARMDMGTRVRNSRLPKE